MTTPAWRSPAPDAPALFDTTPPSPDASSPTPPEPEPEHFQPEPAEAAVPRDRKPRRFANTENMGRPRVGTGKVLGPYETPKELRELVLRFQADQGFRKQADAVRTLLTAGLWAEGYDEAEHLRTVYASPVLRYRPAEATLVIERGGETETVTGVADLAAVDGVLAERDLMRRRDERGQWREDTPGVFTAATRRPLKAVPAAPATTTEPEEG